jgi:hypothetical protein
VPVHALGLRPASASAAARSRGTRAVAFANEVPGRASRCRSPARPFEFGPVVVTSWSSHCQSCGTFRRGAALE